jgi:hypothetical protein
MGSIVLKQERAIVMLPQTLAIWKGTVMHRAYSPFDAGEIDK